MIASLIGDATSSRKGDDLATAFVVYRHVGWGVSVTQAKEKSFNQTDVASIFYFYSFTLKYTSIWLAAVDPALDDTKINMS